MKETSKPRKGYWYKFYIGECPVCGRDKSFKQRVYNQPKPIEHQDRYEYLDDFTTYDYCEGY